MNLLFLSISSFTDTPNPGVSATLNIAFSILWSILIISSLENPAFSEADSLVSSQAKFGTDAPKCIEAAVHTGPRGLWGIISI